MLYRCNICDVIKFIALEVYKHIFHTLVMFITAENPAQCSANYSEHSCYREVYVAPMCDCAVILTIILITWM